MVRKNLNQLQAEIIGVSAIVAAIRGQFDSDNGTKLCDEYIEAALYGVENHLDRIVEDLEGLDERLVERGGVMA